MKRAHSSIPMALKVQEPISVTELELVWAMISSIFHIGVRRFVFDHAVPENLDAVIEDKIKAFFEGAPAAMAAPCRGHAAARQPADM